MKSFYKEISERLEFQSAELGKFIEPQHKELIRNSYKCMAACHRLPDSLEKSNQCADKCHELVKKAQTEVQQHVEGIQIFFQDCMHSCRVSYPRQEAEIKDCIIRCADQSSLKFIQARKVGQEIMTRYNIT